MSALQDEIRAVVREEVRAALGELLEPAAARGARRALEDHQADGVIDTAGLAEILGCPSATAAKRRIDRDPELRALAITGGNGTRWTFRRSEVLALFARRRGERKGAR